MSDDSEFSSVIFNLLHTDQIDDKPDLPDAPGRAARAEIIKEYLRQCWPLLFGSRDYKN